MPAGRSQEWEGDEHGYRVVAWIRAYIAIAPHIFKSHIRNIRFEGNIGAYIADLAIVCFTGIKHTADWFLASFKENEFASSFIDWAKKEIEAFAEIFRKQVMWIPKHPQMGDGPTQNTNLPSIGTPPVPALPSYLKQPKSSVPSSRSSDSDRVPSSPSLKSSDRAPTPSSKLSDRAPTLQSLKPDRAPTPQSHKSSERIPTPLDLGTTDPPLIFPLTSPASPYTSFPHSAASADVFTTFGTMLSSPGANGQAVFSIPSRSGARTPVSSKEPSKSLGPPPSSQGYISPLSSPGPPNIPRTLVKMPSSASLNAGAGAGAGAGATTRLLSARAPPRALRMGVPPTPARSTSRLAGHRPPPVAVPPHDGMTVGCSNCCCTHIMNNFLFIFNTPEL
ncbi:hypothetical protein F5887DRAFT_1281424 [Amanita rubescens]|nr:hypothetical protein F5887DRAFT_1281424 [Amanita rubescens]